MEQDIKQTKPIPISQDEQEKFIDGRSLIMFFLGPMVVYFWITREKKWLREYLWKSLFIPFYAIPLASKLRKIVWESGSWKSFQQYYYYQKNAEKRALISGILLYVPILLIFALEVVFLIIIIDYFI